jgi:hypothetical protein
MEIKPQGIFFYQKSTPAPIFLNISTGIGCVSRQIIWIGHSD